MNPKSEAQAVSQYEPFVLKTAQRFVSSGVASEDLIQEGRIAVALAFRTWTEEGGANFLTWIRKPVYYAMLKLVRSQKRAGGTFRGSGRGLRKGEANKTTIVSLDAGDGEWREYRPQGLKGFGRTDPDEKHLVLHERVGSFEEPSDPFIKGRLPEMISCLEQRERQVLRLRFERGLTYAEVGGRLKISRERARQIEQEALGRLRGLMVKGEKVES